MCIVDGRRQNHTALQHRHSALFCYFAWIVMLRIINIELKLLRTVYRMENIVLSHAMYEYVRLKHCLCKARYNDTCTVMLLRRRRCRLWDGQSDISDTMIFFLFVPRRHPLSGVIPHSPHPHLFPSLPQHASTTSSKRVSESSSFLCEFSVKQIFADGYSNSSDEIYFVDFFCFLSFWGVIWTEKRRNGWIQVWVVREF